MTSTRIIAYAPATYMTQPFYRYCGTFQVTTILESRLGVRKNYKEIFGGFSRLTGFCMPKQLVRKFNEFGLHATFISKKRLTLEHLKEHIKNDKNIILLTVHGYNRKGNSFNPLKALFAQHYISIRGYDPQKQGFYVYDSSLKQTTDASELPVGNLFLPESIVKKGLYWGGWGLLSNIAICVG